MSSIGTHRNQCSLLHRVQKSVYIRTINSHAGYLGFKMVEEPEAQHASYGTASRVRLPEGDFRYVSTKISNMGKPDILVRDSSVRRSTRE